MSRIAAVAAAFAAILCLASCGRLSVDEVRNAPTKTAADAIASAVTKDESSAKIADAIRGAIAHGEIEASLSADSGTLSAKLATARSEGRAAIKLALAANGREDVASLYVGGGIAVLDAPSILGGAYGVRLDEAVFDGETPAASTAEYDLRAVTAFCSKLSAILDRLKEIDGAGGYLAAAIERLDKCAAAIEEREIALYGRQIDAIAVDYRLNADDLSALGIPLSSICDLAGILPELSALDTNDASLSATVLIDRSTRRAIKIDGALAPDVSITLDFTPEHGEDLTLSAPGASLAASRRLEGGAYSFSVDAAIGKDRAALELNANAADGAFALRFEANDAPFRISARASGTFGFDGDALTVEAKDVALGESAITGTLALTFRPGVSLSPTPECAFVSDLDDAAWAKLASNVAANGDGIRAISSALTAIIDDALNTRLYELPGDETDDSTALDTSEPGETSAAESDPGDAVE